ncbi:hypothetical protein V1525DRAFT_405462 [Lipomyces kononenkoae]|uniref:Uncharacterized protein n=1 Tax=Lipomyces kononenkoae TaxID=34357 RepID=A0ACC3SZ97_LIPKO
MLCFIYFTRRSHPTSSSCSCTGLRSTWLRSSTCTSYLQVTRTPESLPKKSAGLSQCMCVRFFLFGYKAEPNIRFNTLHFIWLLFIAHGHFAVALVVAIINFLFISALYWQKRAHTINPPTKWLTIHIGAVAMPFAWTLFALFWSGAVVVHSDNIIAHVFANIFIWSLLIIPTIALLVFADWSFGYASAFLMWGLAVGQFMEKTLALQWIFAFVIAAILTVESALTMLATGFSGLAHTRDNNFDEVLENVREGHEDAPLMAA